MPNRHYEEVSWILNRKEMRGEAAPRGFQGGWLTQRAKAHADLGGQLCSLAPRPKPLFLSLGSEMTKRTLNVEELVRGPSFRPSVVSSWRYQGYPLVRAGRALKGT